MDLPLCAFQALGASFSRRAKADLESSFHCSHGGAALQVLLYQSRMRELLLKNAADLVPLCIYQALQQPTVIASHSFGLNLTSQEVIVDDLP